MNLFNYHKNHTMKYRFFCTLLFLLGGVGFLSAQMKKIEFERYQLDNGLTVILHEDHSTPIVAVAVMYHVGSKNEKPDRTGFAHFFEHLLFEGSENIERGEFDEYLSNAGGMNNAGTSFDYTVYFESVPSNQLGLALWLESERMLHAKVEKVGIETQREVVKEEKRMRVDNSPYGRWQEEVFALAYDEHPYRWQPIGSMEHLNAASEEDYVNFYRDFYVPNNAVLSIAGDLDIEQTKKWVDKYFSTIPKKESPIYRPTVVEPPLNGEKRDTAYDNIQLPAIFQAYRIPPVGTDDYYALDMLSILLSGGQSSRLYKSLVDEQQLAVATGNFGADLEDPGISIVYGIANIGVNTEDVEKAIDEQIAKVQNELIPEREFQKLRNQVENSIISSNSQMLGIAQSLAEYETIRGDANLINQELDKYLQVTREDIQRVAKKYFKKDNRIVLYYLPKPQEP
jgi:predicted Zn-dependent peptidase